MDITDEEWCYLEPFIPHQNSTLKYDGRPEKYPKREIVNTVRYVVSSGCRWSALPHDLPPGGFLGGYLYDVSNSYVSAWLVSFMCGLISSLIAMALMGQGEGAKAAQTAIEPAPSESTPAQV